MPPVPRIYSTEFRQLLAGLLQKCPSKRLSAAQALELPFFDECALHDGRSSEFLREWTNVCQQHQLPAPTLRRICDKILEKPQFQLAYKAKHYIPVPDALNPVHQ